MSFAFPHTLSVSTATQTTNFEGIKLDPVLGTATSRVGSMHDEPILADYAPYGIVEGGGAVLRVPYSDASYYTVGTLVEYGGESYAVRSKASARLGSIGYAKIILERLDR